jgi:hypothetical protein
MRKSERKNGYTDLGCVAVLVVTKLYLCDNTDNTMPLYSKKEFAKMCGITSKYVSVYQKRGKILYSGDYIDTAIPENRDFLYKCQVEGKSKDIVIMDHTKVEPPRKPTRETHEPNIKQPEREHGGTSYALDQEIKQLELEKKREDLELSKLKRAKLSGEVIPVDLVKNTMAVYGKSTTTAFHNAADNFLMDIQKEAGLTREQIAKMRSGLIATVNTAVDDAHREAVESIRNIVDEYSQTRGQGERIY